MVLVARVNDLVLICIGSSFHRFSLSELELEPELVFNLSSAVYAMVSDNPSELCQQVWLLSTCIHPALP